MFVFAIKIYLILTYLPASVLVSFIFFVFGYVWKAKLPTQAAIQFTLSHHTYHNAAATTTINNLFFHNDPKDRENPNTQASSDHLSILSIFYRTIVY